MELAPITVDRLVTTARRAREHAYAPYSRYTVGAAVLGEAGGVFGGCNVENASYPLSMCAERNAIAAAVAAGERPVAVAVVADDPDVTPCGACRQVLSEFAPDMPVIVAGVAGDAYRTFTLGKLLPAQFRLRR